MTSESTILDALAGHRIELPSWAFGNSGTRFKVFAQQGVPRDPYEKVADAAEVHRSTGVVLMRAPCTSRGTRSPTTPDLARHAQDLRCRASGRSNSNTFQDDDYMLGASAIRTRGSARKAVDAPARVRRHHGRHRLARPQAVVAPMAPTPGPGRDPRRRQDRLAEVARDGLRAASGRTSGWALEHKCSEPLVDDTTDVPDWGTAARPCASRSGDQALVVVDTGHHAPGTQHPVHRRLSCCGPGSSGVRLRPALLRGRRPDGRRRRTRSSCSGSCARW